MQQLTKELSTSILVLGMMCSTTADSAQTSQSVSITDGNNTLTGLTDALTAISGVNATVTDKGNGTFSLIINSNTGAKNALRLRVTEDQGDAGLAAFDTSSNNSTKQVVAAADASTKWGSSYKDNKYYLESVDGYEFKLNSLRPPS